jgi:hypothetical protein
MNGTGAALWAWYRGIASGSTVSDAERFVMRGWSSRPGDGRKMNAFQAAWAKRKYREKKRKEAIKAQEKAGAAL